MRRPAFTQLRQVPSVRVSLTGLVVGCVLPLAAVAGYLLLDFYRHEQQQLIDTTISRARAVMAVVDHDFDSTQSALRALATARALEGGDLAAFHARASGLLPDLHADSILLLNRTGDILMSTRVPYGKPLPKLGLTPLLARTLSSGQAGVSDLFVGPLTGGFLYTMAVPIKRDGLVVMSLNATATPASLNHVLEDQKLPASWRVAIVDSGGHVVARNHDIDQYLGHLASRATQERLASGVLEGALQSVTLDGIPVATVYSKSPVTGWAVVVGIPQAELTAGLCQSLTWLVLATLAALLAGLAYAWLVGGGIVRSVNALVPLARAIAGGALPVVPRLPVREANALAEAMREGADSVRRASAAMREGEQRLSLVAAAAHLGVWERDLLHGAIWVSDAWRSLFGFQRDEELTLERLLERVHPDDRPGLEHTFAQVADGRLPTYATEYRVQLPDGGLRWIGSHGAVELGPAGQPRLVRGVSLDITQRKRDERELQRRQEEVTHLARVSMLGELSGALAHELNQPLTAILSNAQAAQRFMARPQPDLEEVRAILDDIVQEDQRAHEIILRLRRLFGKNETVRQAVDLNALVADALAILRNDLINHGVTVQQNLAPAAAVVWADPVQLQQVLINLVLNASDAMAQVTPAQRLLQIDVDLDSDRVALVVSDNGSGIAAAVLPRLFDPFFTTKQRGMGLGLSICRTIADAHEGRLWADNRLPHGASFHLVLPLAPPERT